MPLTLGWVPMPWLSCASTGISQEAICPSGLFPWQDWWQRSSPSTWGYFVESVYPPTAFDANFDIALALMGFMGGLGTISGPILGALILEPAQQYFTLQFSQNGVYLVIYGALFLVVILLLPRGIIPTLSERWTKFQADRRQKEQEDGTIVTALSPQGKDDAVNKHEGINL